MARASGDKHMTVRNMAWGLVTAGVMAAIPLLAQQAARPSCCSPTTRSMPVAGGNLGNQRYSSLTAINRQNIHTLGAAWRTDVSAVPPATTHAGTQTTPVVVDGVIFLDTPAGGVIAVDGKTGASRWKWQGAAIDPNAPARGGGGGGRGAAGGRGGAAGEAAPGGRGAVAPGGQGAAAPGGRGAAVPAVEGRAPAAVRTRMRATASQRRRRASIAVACRLARAKCSRSRTAVALWPSTSGPVRKPGWCGPRRKTARPSVCGRPRRSITMVSSTWAANLVTQSSPCAPATAAWSGRSVVKPNLAASSRTSTASKPTSASSWSDCEQRTGGAPWTHGAIDPELNLVFYTFNNASGCTNSQDSSGRQGQNLFANTLVAFDAKTGAYKWHFQAVHQDVWDMDNTHPPLLANLTIGGQMRRAIYYGSKSAHLFVLDRANGRPLLKAEETPVTQDSRQKSYPTQPLPNRPLPTCLVWQALDPKNVPGDPWRAVPNYNGYQPDAKGQLVYTEPNYLDPDKPFVELPGRRHAPSGLPVRHAFRPAGALDDQPERRADVRDVLAEPQARPHLLPVRRQPGRALARSDEQRRAGDRAVSSRAASSPSTPRRTPCAGRTLSRPTWATIRARSRRRVTSCSPGWSMGISSGWTRFPARSCGVSRPELPSMPVPSRMKSTASSTLRCCPRVPLAAFPTVRRCPGETRSGDSSLAGRSAPNRAAARPRRRRSSPFAGRSSEDPWRVPR